jgi:hypothetical protein
MWQVELRGLELHPHEEDAAFRIRSVLVERSNIRSVEVQKAGR